MIKCIFRFTKIKAHQNIFDLQPKFLLFTILKMSENHLKITKSSNDV